MLGAIIAATALGQERKFKIAEIFGSGDTTVYVNLVTKVIVPKDGMVIRHTTPPDTARLYLPDDGFKYLATTTFTKIGGGGPAYDTLWKINETVEPENPRVQHVNMITYTNSGKPDISNKSFAAVVGVSAASSSTVTLPNTAMIEFWGERYQGHGTIQIWVDDNLAGTFNQGAGEFNTDLKRGHPTFRRKFPIGTHTVSVRSVTGQHIVDFITAYGYTLQPKK